MLACSMHNIINKNLAIANRSRISCINTNRYSHKLATSGESHWYGFAFTHFVGGGIWLSQESLRHILASPDNRDKCHMVGKRIQCLKKRLVVHIPSYLQSFLRYRPVSESESERKRARNASSESERDLSLASSQAKNFICC